MPQKIFDIFPPKSARPFIKTEPKTLKLENDLKQGRGKKILVFVLVFLILAGIFSYFQFFQVEIEIWPETESLTFNEKITADLGVQQLDFGQKVIPAKLFELEKELEEEFSASGKTLREKRAEGTLKVYNAYSTAPQILVATTRFVSAEGKLFRLPVKVTVPGSHYEAGKFVPGWVEVTIRADLPGEEYNIGPSTFSIPGFAGTPRYTAFYGKSFQAFQGGFSGEVDQVKKEDLDQAKKVLTERLFEEGKTALKNQIIPDFILVDESLNQEITETFSTTKALEEKDNFRFRVKVNSRALAFKKSDLEDFSKAWISLQLNQNQKLQEESLKTEWKLDELKLEAQKIILNLEISAKIYSDINILALKEALRGRLLKETQLLLEDQPEIVKVQLKFWPFWLKKVPENLEKIKIKLNIDPVRN